MLNNLDALKNKKTYNHLDYRLLVHFGGLKVELQGIEPWSKHIRRKLSTCLFSY